MRTRIALVAIIPIALITVALLTLAAIAQPARASIEAPHMASTRPADQLTAFVSKDPATTTTMATGTFTAIPAKASTAKAGIATSTVPDLHKVIALLTMPPVATNDVAPVTPPPVPPPPVPVVIDTVTPAQRSAWNRVAVCEEGGNWQADGSRFSGGLGITRTNWSIYGGLQYASSASQATPDQQIMVAQRIQYSPPDQYGCASW
jgi:hypothetical protein